MNTELLKAKIAVLERATGRFEDALKQPKNEFTRDAAIQRFEFTFELAWRTMKDYLSYMGVEARSPRDCIRGTFTSGLIKEDIRWLAMIELRNLTSHTYEEAMAERIWNELPGILVCLKDLLGSLKSVK